MNSFPRFALNGGKAETKTAILKILFLSFLLCMLLHFGSDILAASPGFPLQDNGSGSETAPDRGDRIRSMTTYQMIFTTLPLAFGIIHLVLFFFLKRAEENLYFAIFSFFYAASIFFDYQSSLTLEVEQNFIYLRLHRAVQPFFVLFYLRFVYSLFYPELPKRFYLFAILLYIPGVYAVFYPLLEQGYKYFNWATIPVTIEIVRIIIQAVKKKKKGAWIIALGFFIYYFFNFFDTLMDLDIGLDVPFTEMENPYAFGTVGFLITMSVYLARNYAGTYERLLRQERLTREQEMEKRLLEADNARKTRELDDARNLQLSMLPECLSDLPGLDTCFFMAPAAEVGGDYYDYQFDKDGTLVLAVGDATGHGMKAGIMVASVKSLFHTIGTNPDIPAFFNRCTAIIKQMHMGNLFMGLTVVRIKDNHMVVSSAGMPPILIFREAEQKVEALVIKGPPLGGFSGFSYTQKETTLMPGDTLLLMSDGFPELFNEKDEMLSYARAKRIFKEVPKGTPDEIIAHLNVAAEKWRNHRAQEDDITFVVIKITQRA